MRKSIVLGSLLLVLFAVPACSTTEDNGSGGSKDKSSSSDQSGKDSSKDSGKDSGGMSTAKVGETITVKGASGAKAEVTVLSVKTYKKGKGEFAEKPANGQFVVVDIQFKATKDTFTVSPAYVSFQTADNKTFEYGDGNGVMAGFDPALDSTDIPSGQTVRGLVVLDTPVGTGKQVILTDELGSRIGVWEI